MNIEEHENWNEFNTKHGSDKPIFRFISTRGGKNIWDVEFNPGDYLIFGSETKGLSEEILNSNKDHMISIPMNGKTGSLNLSTAVGIVLYEAMRQVTMDKGLYKIEPVNLTISL